MITEFFINGEFRHHASKTYKVFAPEDSREIATIPDADKEDVNQAVEAAKDAYYREWKFYDPQKREKLFWKWAECLEASAEEIGRIAGLEMGRAGKDLTGDLIWYADMIRYYAGWINKNYGDVLELTDSYLNYVIREPLGVAAAMVPWNSAVTGAVQKLAPALAAGNTVVLRGSDHVPLGTLALAKTIQDAGFPPGVVNIIAGSNPDSGIALTSHPDVRVISFTGSVSIGQAILKTAADSMKRTIFELGGKSPFIIFADGDLEKAAQKAIEYAFIYQGQMCCAVTRVLVQESVKEEFINLLKRNVARYRPGFPDEFPDQPTIGPLFNETQFKQVSKYVDIGKKDGNLLFGGNRITEGKFGKAFYHQPTIFEFEDDESEVCQQEIFGPVLSVIPFEKMEEAIRIANRVDYALSASVWSKNLEMLTTIIRQLEAGTVWANEYWQFNLHAPWGGFKSSGMGKEYGKYALDDYLEYKNVWLNP